MAAAAPGCRPAVYGRRHPEQTVLYRLVSSVLNVDMGVDKHMFNKLFHWVNIQNWNTIDLHPSVQRRIEELMCSVARRFDEVFQQATSG